MGRAGIDKYRILLISSAAISLSLGFFSYFVTDSITEKNLLLSTIESANNYVEVAAAAIGSAKEREKLKEILERAPYVRKVSFGKGKGESCPFAIERNLLFHDGTLKVKLFLNKEEIKAKASSIAKKVAFAVFVVTSLLQGLLFFVVRRFYLLPLKRIRQDVDKIYEGKLEKVPETGKDEFGRIRKSINQMIDGIRERDEKAEIISQFIQLLTVGKGFNEDFIELMKKALKITNTDGAIIGVLKGSKKDRVEIRVITLKENYTLERSIFELKGIEPYILEMGREVETAKENVLSKEERSLGIKYFIGLPMTVFSRTVGYCIFFRRRHQPFSEENKKFIRNIAKAIGISVENRNLIEELRQKLEKEARLTDTIIKSLVRGIEIRDSYTRGHSERVAYFSRRIAQEMGLPEEEVRNIYLAGLLHDIGKIGIPDSILLKPGKLSDKEYEIIKLHPLLSYELLKNIEPLKGALDGIRYHHERWDGRGYPEGLRGRDIPISARIIAVADSYDAMTSERIYRKGRSKRDALKEIMNMAGKLYDPDVVSAAVPILLNEEPRELREDYLNVETIKEIEERRLDYFLRDSLTGVFNRNSFEYVYSLVREQLKEFKAYSLDIAKLREINIRNGWSYGDKLLKELVSLLEKEIRPNYIVRYSGDNFIFFVPASKPDNEVSEKIKEIEKALGVSLILVKLKNTDDIEKLKVELTELEFNPPAE